MIEIPATEKRLRAAHFFWGLLQARAQQLGTDPEEVEFLLGAFLLAAYSVEGVLDWERGQAYPGWVRRWWTDRSPDDQAFHRFMEGERHAEVHREGLTVRREQQNIPGWEYLLRKEAGRKSRGHPALDGMSMSYGPWGLAPLPLEFPIDILKLGNEEAVKTCARYFDLLKQMVQTFRETTADATEQRQQQVRIRSYKIWLDPERLALVEELRHTEESLDDLIARALHALHDR